MSNVNNKSKQAQKSKASEPSLRDKLSQSFMKAMQADFETHGVEVIERLREADPAKYTAIAAQLIATLEPRSDSYDDCQTHEAIARKMLSDIGIYEATPVMVAEVLAARDVLIAKLEQIKAQAEGQIQ